ncbi:MAG: hypothetical protein KAI66_10705 [Lentisphaeria bacterium]|nr:hypothetical protein [Lentisphaeria bacterium]
MIFSPPWAFAVLVLLCGATARSDGKKAAQGADASLQQAVADVLSVLADRELLPPRTADTRRAVQQAVLDAVGSGARVTAPPESMRKGMGSPAREGHPLSVRSGVLDGTYWHVKILRVDPDLRQELSGVLEGVAHGHFEAFVIDLRGTGGSDAKAAGKIGRQLLSAKLPIAVLANADTTGAGEQLVRNLAAGGAVVVGTSTAGTSSQVEIVALPSGDQLVLSPRGAVRTGGVRPHVPVAAADDPKLARATDEPSPLDKLISRDACLRKATDLLAAICVLGGE